ncbi:MAG: YfhO family protein [Anaerolineae bacterium]
MSTLAFALTSYLVALPGYLSDDQRRSAALAVMGGSWCADTGRLRDLAWLALFTAMQLLAGHAQTTWYSLLLTGVFAVYWLARYERKHWRRAALGAGAVVLALGISMVQLLPTAELLTQSQRSSGVDYDFAMNFSYGPLRTVNFFAPNFFGNPGDGTYITKGAFFEDAVYVGFIPLLAAFAAFAGWIARRRAQARPAYYSDVPFWWALVIVGFVLALGKYSPIFPFLYDNVPTFDVFQAPVRWQLWTVFALSVLAGIGVQSWGKGKWRIFWTRLALAGSVFAALIAIYALPRILPDAADEGSGVAVLVAAIASTGIIAAMACALTLLQPEKGSKWEKWQDAWAAVVLVFIAADLGWAAWGLNPTVPTSFFDQQPTNSDARSYWTEEASRAMQYEQFLPFNDYRIAAQDWQTYRASHLANLNLLDRAYLLNNFDPLLIDGFKQFTA